MEFLYHNPKKGLKTSRDKRGSSLGRDLSHASKEPNFQISVMFKTVFQREIHLHSVRFKMHSE